MRDITRRWLVILIWVWITAACSAATESPTAAVQPDKPALQFVEFYSPM